MFYSVARDNAGNIEDPPAIADLAVETTDVLDADDDGVEDGIDNCPYRANPDQADANGDGVGDVCQCGDMNGNGFLDGADLTLYKRYFGGLPGPFSVDRCGINPGLDGGVCDGADFTVIKRYFGGLLPWITNSCSAYVGP